MSVAALTFLVTVLFATSVVAGSMRIEDKVAATAYLDQVFAENDCAMSFAQIDGRMRTDGIIPTEAEMSSADVGVTKFIRLRRVMGALETLSESGQVVRDDADATRVISRFGGCA